MGGDTLSPASSAASMDLRASLGLQATFSSTSCNCSPAAASTALTSRTLQRLGYLTLAGGRALRSTISRLWGLRLPRAQDHGRAVARASERLSSGEPVV